MVKIAGNGVWYRAASDSRVKEVKKRSNYMLVRCLSARKLYRVCFSALYNFHLDIMSRRVKKLVEELKVFEGTISFIYKGRYIGMCPLASWLKMTCI